MMAAITMGSDGDSLRLGREAWICFISGGSIKVFQTSSSLTPGPPVNDT